MSKISPKDMQKMAQEMISKMKEAKSKKVVVGILADKATTSVYETGVNVLEVGTWHEYGRGNNPKRSFLNNTLDKNIRAIKKKNFDIFENVLNTDQSVDNGLGIMGAYFNNLVKDAFTNNGYGTWAPLEPETIKAKGSSRTLIDKGTLRRSITWEVR